MEYQVLITRTARDDIYNIAHYITFQLQSPNSANAIVKEIEKTVYSLDQMPERFPVYHLEPLRGRGVRFVRVRNFSVFYTVDDSLTTVNVLRILYCRMDTENMV